MPGDPALHLSARLSLKRARRSEEVNNGKTLRSGFTSQSVLQRGNRDANDEENARLRNGRDFLEGESSHYSSLRSCLGHHAENEQHERKERYRRDCPVRPRRHCRLRKWDAPATLSFLGHTNPRKSIQIATLLFALLSGASNSAPRCRTSLSAEACRRMTMQIDPLLPCQPPKKNNTSTK